MGPCLFISFFLHHLIEIRKIKIKIFTPYGLVFNSTLIIKCLTVLYVRLCLLTVSTNNNVAKSHKFITISYSNILHTCPLFNTDWLLESDIQFNSLLSKNIKFIANYIYINGVIYIHINTNTYEKSVNKKTKYVHISTINNTRYIQKYIMER